MIFYACFRFYKIQKCIQYFEQDHSFLSNRKKARFSVVIYQGVFISNNILKENHVLKAHTYTQVKYGLHH